MSGQINRLDWVDTAKGISIILVVMMYSVFNVGTDTGEAGFWHYVIGFATPFRMPEFFLISGLFLSLVIARPWRAFADRRVVHYLYFYALWAVIHLVLKVGLASAAIRSRCVQQIALGDRRALRRPLVHLSARRLQRRDQAPLRAQGAALGRLRLRRRAADGARPHRQLPRRPVLPSTSSTSTPATPSRRRSSGFVAWTQRNIAARRRRPRGLRRRSTALLVFSPGFDVGAHDIQMGLAALPGVRLALALAGSLALCVVAALLARLPWMGWLRWLGERSLVVYLAFVLPMSFSRIALEKIGLIEDTTILSTLVIVIAILASLALYWLVQWTGRGKFLFERPAWAHLPGTKGSRELRGAARGDARRNSSPARSGHWGGIDKVPPLVFCGPNSRQVGPCAPPSSSSPAPTATATSSPR